MSRMTDIEAREILKQQMTEAGVLSPADATWSMGGENPKNRIDWAVNQVLAMAQNPAAQRALLADDEEDLFDGVVDTAYCFKGKLAQGLLLYGELWKDELLSTLEGHGLNSRQITKINKHITETLAGYIKDTKRRAA